MGGDEIGKVLLGFLAGASLMAGSLTGNMFLIVGGIAVSILILAMFAREGKL